MDWQRILETVLGLILTGTFASAVFMGWRLLFRARTERIRVTAGNELERIKVQSELDTTRRDNEVTILQGLLKEIRAEVDGLRAENGQLRDDVTTCLIDRQQLRGVVNWLRAEVKRLGGREPPEQPPAPKGDRDSKEWGRGQNPVGG